MGREKDKGGQRAGAGRGRVRRLATTPPPCSRASRRPVEATGQGRRVAAPAGSPAPTTGAATAAEQAGGGTRRRPQATRRRRRRRGSSFRVVGRQTRRLRARPATSRWTAEGMGGGGGWLRVGTGGGSAVQREGERCQATAGGGRVRRRRLGRVCTRGSVWACKRDGPRDSEHGGGRETRRGTAHARARLAWHTRLRAYCGQPATPVGT